MKEKRLSYTVVSCLFLVAVTGAVYSPIRQYPFLNYDDQEYVTRNPHVQAGLSWKTLRWAWTATDAYNWHPLTWLSHVVDWQFYGLNAGGHHLTNLLFGCVNAVLLFLLLLWATESLGRSLLVATVFALHPFNVESVVWIAERKNLLSTMFFLLAIGAYGWYAIKPGVKRYLLLAFFFALGLASKPMVITLPLVLLLLDFWPLQRIRELVPAQAQLERIPKRRKSSSRRAAETTRSSVSQAPLRHLILEKLPLLAFCLVSAIVTVIAQSRGGAVRSLEKIPLPLRIENAIYSYAMYVWKAFWPARFALYYPLHPVAFWQLGLAVLFLLLVSALAWNRRFKQPYLLMGWLWYLVTLVPVIGIIQVGDQAMADRYAYLPLIGIFVMAVWGFSDVAERMKMSAPLSAGLAAIVVAILSFLTWRQQGYWRSNYNVWSHTLAVTGPNPVAESDLADALHSLGRAEDALPHFQNAVRMQSKDPDRRIDLAEDLAECGRLQDAVAEYEAAIQLTTNPEKQARSYESLAILQGELGEYSKVRESYHEALITDPQLSEDMIRNLSRAFAANPSVGGYLSLGMFLEAAGRLSEARAAYQQALELDPTLAEAKKSLNALGREKQ